ELRRLSALWRSPRRGSGLSALRGRVRARGAAKGGRAVARLSSSRGGGGRTASAIRAVRRRRVCPEPNASGGAFRAAARPLRGAGGAPHEPRAGADGHGPVPPAHVLRDVVARAGSRRRGLAV